MEFLLHYMGAGIGLGLAVIGAGLGIGRLAAGMAEGIARQPSAVAQITGASILMRPEEREVVRVRVSIW